MASRPESDASAQQTTCEVQPTEVCYGTVMGNKSPNGLRVATGGAGQSGLLRALADAFLDDQVSGTKYSAFTVSWITSDTTASFNHLVDDSADLSITYNEAAEDIPKAQGIADKHVYAWRDHFLLVGNYEHLSRIPTRNEFISYG